MAIVKEKHWYVAIQPNIHRYVWRSHSGLLWIDGARFKRLLSEHFNDSDFVKHYKSFDDVDPEICTFRHNGDWSIVTIIFNNDEAHAQMKLFQGVFDEFFERYP